MPCDTCPHLVDDSPTLPVSKDLSDGVGSVGADDARGRGIHRELSRKPGAEVVGEGSVVDEGGDGDVVEGETEVDGQDALRG